jgi:rhodanese-related sulfurtransferase
LSCKTKSNLKKVVANQKLKSIANTISTDEFQKIIKQKKEVLILDVRTPKEVSLGAIEGNINLDFYGADFKKLLNRLDKEKPVMVYCASGRRSKNAMGIMKKLGFKEIYNLLGGITAWKAEGKPIQ